MSKPPSPKSADKPPAHAEVYYNQNDGSYLYKLQGEYVALKHGDMRRHMRAMGLRDDKWFDGQHEQDWPMYNAVVNRRVNFAGPLGGRRVGMFTDGSNRKFLVTEEARGVWEDLPKKWSVPKFFGEFIAELLPDGQWERLCYWLAIGVKSLREGDFRPGQVSIFAGEVRCGKSLLQCIITEILGGRSGNPMRYMMEETSFNEDFAGCEHWMIEEPKTSTDIRTRIAFGNAIKECFVNRDFSIHPKGKKAISLPVFRRGTISINDEPELLIVLPPFNGSVDDKINLFHCAKVVEVFKPFIDPATGLQDRKRLWQTILDEIPMIRAWLLKAFKTVPPALRDDRFGVTFYHHPTLRMQLASFAPEVKLLELIDLSLADKAQDGELFEGKAIDLEQVLRGSKYAFDVDRVLRGTGRVGTYLGRLKKSHPERISSRMRDGHTIWKIMMEPSTPVDENKPAF